MQRQTLETRKFYSTLALTVICLIGAVVIAIVNPKYQDQLFGALLTGFAYGLHWIMEHKRNTGRAKDG
jgi:hypothetical protein